MKEDLRRATDAVVRLNAKGEKEFYIDKCDLSPLDAEILKRRLCKRQSVTEISLDLHISRESVQSHYRDSMLVLHDILKRCKA